MSSGSSAGTLSPSYMYGATASNSSSPASSGTPRSGGGHQVLISGVDLAHPDPVHYIGSLVIMRCVHVLIEVNCCQLGKIHHAANTETEVLSNASHCMTRGIP